MNKTFTLTVNGQLLNFRLEGNEAFQISEYYSRSGKGMGRTLFGGYESGRAHFCSTRTIANMVERFVKTQ